ncbi:MAG: acetyl-CoA carboxylase biotin carboxyl carrier protein [Burkholderiaceae bacterium]|jgi:acetyl-CoA carboxylase biotin carboxyl carrier protein|nr:acetyl-CoA carboxylase, biotin carboxyl carrier protein [Burkholderiales bacterium]MCZ8340576.1 acetyl-CoA carboxylase biotin carboxyl carrier protein [Burkholderiaceae bacterium]
MKLTHDDVERILKLLEASAFEALDLEIDGLKLSLRRRGAASAGADPAAVPPSASAPSPAAPSPPSSTVGGTDVLAPVLGTFYRAPKPGAAPFVEIGAKVAPDTVVCIVEVMKLMTSVTAGVAGEVVELLATDGTLVEYGQPLLRIRPGA